jgi:DNA-binding transcriptional ArsR family regulator
VNEKSKRQFHARARIIKALAHPTRLFVVDELSRGERCVCELTEMVGADISTVSKHLSVLKQAGIVEDEKRGVQVWYRLRVPCILNFFGCVEDVLKANVVHARQSVTR